MEATQSPCRVSVQAVPTTDARGAPGAAGSALRVRLQSADGQNRLSRSTVLQLRDALRQAADPAIALVVVEAAGEAFCAGGDQREQAAMDGGAFRAFAADLVALHAGVLGCAAPVLACVQRHAVGGGAALALMCDLVVVAADAKFAFPEARLGLAGPGFLLHRAGAFQRFAGLCLSGRAHTGQELLAMGLVNAVVPRASFDAEADAFMRGILRQTPAGLRATKASLAAAALPMLGTLERHFEIQAQAFEQALAQESLP